MSGPGALRAQSGMTLLLGLLLVTALGLVALAASSDSVLQARMVENLQRADRSAATAGSALAWAEDWLLSLDGSARPLPCTEPCAPGKVIHALGSYPAAPEFAGADWWEAHGRLDGQDPATGATLMDRAGVTGMAGRWLVEEAWFEEARDDGSGIPAVSYYRILAHGTVRGGQVAVVESILARPWGDPGWVDPFPAGLSAPRFCRSQPVTVLCGRLAWRQRR